MKEIYKQLALQAGGSHYPDVGGDLLEKFAELLVKECIDVVGKTPTTDACTTFDLGLIEGTIDKSIKQLKQRFEL